MAARFSSAEKAGKIATPPTITKIVANKADFMVSILPIRHLRDEVLENLPALSRNQRLAHSHCSSRVAIQGPITAINFSTSRSALCLGPFRVLARLAHRLRM